VPQQAPPPARAPIRPTEEKPPVGTDLTLGAAQIRYCLAESIRLDSAEGAISKVVQRDVDRFNSMVSDFNNRCAKYKYYRSVMDSAKAEIEPYRAAIQAEGRMRFSR